MASPLLNEREIALLRLTVTGLVSKLLHDFFY